MTGRFATLSSRQLDTLIAEPDCIGDFFFAPRLPENTSRVLDIDKAWHGLHYLLTGTAYGGEPPASLPVLGGEEFGPEIVYGPARYLTPPQVRDAAAYLTGVSIEHLRPRFRPQSLEEADIYPGFWERDGETAFEYLAHSYVSLQQFYAQAAAQGQVMLLAIV